MRRDRFIIAIVMLAAIWCEDVFAQSNAHKNDSIATVLLLKSLKYNRDRLQKKIEVEDGKRNKQISGVSAETLEEMNDRQDSVCLALRSELADVVLEIKELSSVIVSPKLMGMYNNLFNKKDEAPLTDESKKSITPAKK